MTIQPNLIALLEVIIHAAANQPEAVAVLSSGDQEIAVVEIDKEVLDLGAPAWRETEFGAHSRRPAGVGMALRQPERLAAQLAEGETGGAIEQDVVDGVTGAPAHRAEPWIGELPRRKRV